VKTDQERAASDLLERQIKLAAETNKSIQKEIKHTVKQRQKSAAVLREEQIAAAAQLTRNQEVCLHAHTRTGQQSVSYL